MSNQPDDQDDPNALPPESNDFANFDPETYLRERRAREGRSRGSEDLTRSDEETLHARRHSRGGREENLESEIDDGATDVPVGLTSRVVGFVRAHAKVQLRREVRGRLAAAYLHL